MVYNDDCYPAYAPRVYWGPEELVGPDGMWSGWFNGTVDPDRGATGYGATSYVVMVGSGGYRAHLRRPRHGCIRRVGRELRPHLRGGSTTHERDAGRVTTSRHLPSPHQRLGQRPRGLHDGHCLARRRRSGARVGERRPVSPIARRHPSLWGQRTKARPRGWRPPRPPIRSWPGPSASGRRAGR